MLCSTDLFIDWGNSSNNLCDYLSKFGETQLPVVSKTSLVIYLFIYLGFYIAFNTVQVISRRVVGRAEETSTYSSLGFCTVNCQPTASNYQLSHLRPYRGSNPGLRGRRRECYHSATVAPNFLGESGNRSSVQVSSVTV